MEEAVVIVKCISCGNKREIKQGDVEENDFPMCVKCFSPMFPMKVTIKEGK